MLQKSLYVFRPDFLPLLKNNVIKSLCFHYGRQTICSEATAGTLMRSTRKRSKES